MINTFMLARDYDLVAFVRVAAMPRQGILHDALWLGQYVQWTTWTKNKNDPLISDGDL
jgi:hypothetical protein